MLTDADQRALAQLRQLRALDLKGCGARARPIATALVAACPLLAPHKVFVEHKSLGEAPASGAPASGAPEQPPHSEPGAAGPSSRPPSALDGDEEEMEDDVDA